MTISNLPDPHNDVAKKQHIVPRTYTKSWSPDEKHVYTFNKLEKIPSIRFPYMTKINYIRNTYDILPGDYFTPVEALKDIFGFLDDYRIEYGGNKLSSRKELNENYKNFDSWTIIKPNGDFVTEEEKDQIKVALKEARYPFTEKAWNTKYENGWNSFATDLERRLRNAITFEKNEGTDKITSDTLSMVIEYYLMFDFRSESRNEFIDNCINDTLKPLQNVLPEVDDILPVKDRIHMDEDTYTKQVRGNLYRKAFYKFLYSGSGYIKTTLDKYRQMFEIHFILTEPTYPFITSNNPAFTHTYEDGKKENVFIALPTLAIMMGKGDNGKFIVSNADRAKVDRLNKIVYQDNDVMILPSDAFDLKRVQN